VRDLLESIFTIEQDGGFLESAVLGLNDEEVAEDQLEGDPDDVDDVVLPADVRKGDGVDILVEDEGQGDGEVEDVEALGTDVVGQNLDGVGDDERREGNVVETVVQEDECNDGVTSRLGSVLGVESRADGLEGEHDDHTSGGHHEHAATSTAFNEEGGNDGDDKVVDLKTTVDTELSGGVGDTDGVEDLAQVVGDETVTGPLREEGNGDDNPHAASVTGGGEEAAVTNVGGDGAIELDGGLDFLVLVNDKRVLVVSASVVVTQDVESLLLTALGDQPTRGLGNEPDEEDLCDGREGLESGGDTP